MLVFKKNIANLFEHRMTDSFGTNLQKKIILKKILQSFTKESYQKN